MYGNMFKIPETLRPNRNSNPKARKNTLLIAITSSVSTLIPARLIAQHISQIVQRLFHLRSP